MTSEPTDRLETSGDAGSQQRPTDASPDAAADGCIMPGCDVAPPSCVVARRIACCDHHQAATTDELASNECLVLPTDPEVSWDVRERCRRLNPGLPCNLIFGCTPYDPFENLEAVPDDRGGCRFASE
jgi:hypothetical protein